MEVVSPVALSLGFSQVVLRAEHPTVLRLLAHHYDMHRFVYGVVQPSPGKERILYRVEARLDQFGIPRPTVLIQHSRTPNLKLSEDQQRFADLESKEVSMVIRPGAYRFRLRANPVKSIPSDTKGVRGTRRGLTSDNERRDWLVCRFHNHGMEVMAVDIVAEPLVEFAKSGARGRGNIAVAGVMYNGVVDIHNPERAASIIKDGIGRARGFGYGLISLAPVR
jgi:CRISPR system Cascade subunit CasE